MYILTSPYGLFLLSSASPLSSWMVPDGADASCEGILGQSVLSQLGFTHVHNVNSSPIAFLAPQ